MVDAVIYFTAFYLGKKEGAIVGGLYASGYTGKDIEKIVMETDFYNLLSNANNRAETSFFNKSPISKF